jgi:hypothetical protein
VSTHTPLFAFIPKAVGWSGVEWDKCRCRGCSAWYRFCVRVGTLTCRTPTVVFSSVKKAWKWRGRPPPPPQPQPQPQPQRYHHHTRTRMYRHDLRSQSHSRRKRRECTQQQSSHSHLCPPPFPLPLSLPSLSLSLRGTQDKQDVLICAITPEILRFQDKLAFKAIIFGPGFPYFTEAEIAQMPLYVASLWTGFCT